MRYERMNPCKECMKHSASCGGENTCKQVRQKKLRPYTGIRFTSDGFDCAFPVSIDVHSVCSFGCLYCFAVNTIQGRVNTITPIGEASLSKLEGIFSGKSESKEAQMFRRALKYHDRNENGYPCAVQLGAISDPMDNIERQRGWFLKFAEIVKKYDQPVKISTKGNLFLEKEYLDAVKDKPELFFVTYSIITPDDKVIKEVEPRAPNATERLQCMKNLTDLDVKVGLRLRPMLPGVSDSTPDYPQAYKTLIERSVDAGATAISFECAFVPGRMTEDMQNRWKTLEKIVDKPLVNIYNNFGKNQACMRPPYQWTEQIMHAVYEEAKKHDLVIGVSDPAWKQLTEVGCCCGITEDDPVFGNWQRESATNQLMIARDTGKLLSRHDITPEWASHKSLCGLVNPGVGPTAAYTHRHGTWAEVLSKLWNNPEKERSPLYYFQGALIPVKRDKDGELYYKYQGLKRKTPENTPFWKIN